MPVITRAAVETEVVSEVGPLLTLAGKSVLTNGANPDLTGPLSFTLQALGITPQDPTSPGDVDFQLVPLGQYTVVCQVTEYYAIKKCLNSITLVNEKAQDRTQDWDEMIRRFAEQERFLQNLYAAYLNIRINPTVTGVLSTRFPTPTNQWFAIGCGRIDH